MIKKLQYLLLAALIFTLVACGSKANNSMNPNNINDDTVIVNANADSNIIYGGTSGNNTITNNGKYNQIAGFGTADNATAITFSPYETQNITINGISYSIKNNASDENVFLYSYNSITGEVSLGGRGFTVRGQTDISHNVNCYGYFNFYGGDKNDTINIYAAGSYYGQGGNDNLTTFTSSSWSNLYGGDGDDILTAATGSGGTSLFGQAGNDTLNINSSCNSINGGVDDDIYNINYKVTITDDGGNNIYNVDVDGTTITGADGNDTFYINSNNNTILGAGGDDYFVIKGTNNFLDGGTGTNYYIDNGSGTSISNVHKDPNSGGLSFTYEGEVQIILRVQIQSNTLLTQTLE